MSDFIGIGSRVRDLRYGEFTNVKKGMVVGLSVYHRDLVWIPVVFDGSDAPILIEDKNLEVVDDG